MMNLPVGYQTIMLYIIVKQAAKFSKFCKKVFDAEEKMRFMRDEDHIMHAEITIGESVIMFADTTDQIGPRTAGMFVYVENTDETYKRALEEGATSISPPADQPYGRSAGFIDPFGNSWWPTQAPVHSS